MRTESGERMTMVYFPEHKLLYGSDLVQQRRDGSFFVPEYLSELIDAVRRENLIANLNDSSQGDLERFDHRSAARS